MCYEKIYNLLGFLCLCLELAAQTYPKEGNVIRILTYNTHYCKGGTDPGSINDANTRLLASVIKTLDADVVSLQDLTVRQIAGENAIYWSK